MRRVEPLSVVVCSTEIREPGSRAVHLELFSKAGGIVFNTNEQPPGKNENENLLKEDIAPLETSEGTFLEHHLRAPEITSVFFLFFHLSISTLKYYQCKPTVGVVSRELVYEQSSTLGIVLYIRRSWRKKDNVVEKGATSRWCLIRRTIQLHRAATGVWRHR